MKTGVYQIRNLRNGKRYIGSTSYSFRIRWNMHRSRLRTNKHHSIKLQNAWNKYGEDAFVFEVLEECIEPWCLTREQFYLDRLLFASAYDNRFHRLGYNVSRVASNCTGVKHTIKTRQKKSLISRGVLNPRALLNEQQVKEIRFLLDSGWTQQAIANRFKVSRSAVRDIKLGKRWSHI